MHVRRYVSAFAALLSLVVSIATAALWVRSLTTADELDHSCPTRVEDRYARIDWTVLSGYGFLAITRARMIPPDEAAAAWLERLDRGTGYGWSFGVVDGYGPSSEGFVEGLRRIGLSSGNDVRGKVLRQWTSVEVPDWLLLLVVSVPAVVFFIRVVQARRRRNRRGFPARVVGESGAVEGKA